MEPARIRNDDIATVDSYIRPAMPWTDDLPYAIDVYDQVGNLIEPLGSLCELDPARAAYEVFVKKYPDKLIVLRHKARVLASSRKD